MLFDSVFSFIVKHENLSLLVLCSFGRRSIVGIVLGHDFVQSCTVLFNASNVQLCL